MPFAILGLWFRGLLALGIIGGGIWLLTTWYDALPRVTPGVQTDPAGPRSPARPLSFGERVAHWHPALSWETAALGGGLLLVLVASGGGLLVVPMHIKLSTLRKLLWHYRVAVPTIMLANKELPYDDHTTGGPCPA